MRGEERGVQSLSAAGHYKFERSEHPVGEKTSRRFSHAKKKPLVGAVRSVCFLQHMKSRALKILGGMRNLSARERYKIIKHRGV